MPGTIHLTVAVVVERCLANQNPQYLMVREVRDGREVYNQPAGHVEPGETPYQAAIRETLEETAWHIKPAGVISFSTCRSKTNGVTYYRLALSAEVSKFDHTVEIDSDIEEALWLSYEQILGLQPQLRSPMVLQAIDDFRSKRIYSLDLLKVHE